MTQPVAGTEAAMTLLSRSDVRPTSVHLSENGDMLVWWRLEGLRDRDLFRCRYPVALTFAPREAWQSGLETSEVRAWLLADGERAVEPTRAGFYLDGSNCTGRPRTEQAPALVIHRGRLRSTRLVAATADRQRGALHVFCPPGTPGACQVDPRTGNLQRLQTRASWDGAWDPGRSILWRESAHITGTWSVDGGRSWNQFMDPWDATALRRGDELYAASDSVMGRPLERIGVLTGGEQRKGVTEWFPENLTVVERLPTGEERNRSWTTTSDDTLVGLGGGGALYVSDGPDWSTVRRTEEDCRLGDLVGRFLTCWPPRPEGHTGDLGELRISDDLGRTWVRIQPDRILPDANDRP
ncbi:hypothetical protein [Nocardioides coralli]|uniref:hypothetical protein n=1 Tax=Nocardioides coralli TaxID=2872154 RepID=UPI001CA3E9C9|nr:hypothetical protein [Nocardioides coralli]QZY28410.1 hypothetical protein K6T13_13160 [Nocardioides coralli]